MKKDLYIISIFSMLILGVIAIFSVIIIGMLQEKPSSNQPHDIATEEDLARDSAKDVIEKDDGESTSVLANDTTEEENESVNHLAQTNEEKQESVTKVNERFLDYDFIHLRGVFQLVLTQGGEKKHIYLGMTVEQLKEVLNDPAHKDQWDREMYDNYIYHNIKFEFDLHTNELIGIIVEDKLDDYEKRAFTSLLENLSCTEYEGGTKVCTYDEIQYFNIQSPNERENVTIILFVE